MTVTYEQQERYDRLWHHYRDKLIDLGIDAKRAGGIIGLTYNRLAHHDSTRAARLLDAVLASPTVDATNFVKYLQHEARR